MSLRGLLLRFLAFALALAGPAVVVEHRFRATPTTYSVKHQWLEAHAPDVEVLVLGSSSALNGVQPKYFYDASDFRAYNCGGTAQSIYYNHEILERYLGRMKHLRLVIMTMDYVTLESRMPDSIEEWRQFFYAREFGFPPEGGIDPYDIRFASVFELYPQVFRTACMFNDCDHRDGLDSFAGRPRQRAPSTMRCGGFKRRIDGGARRPSAPTSRFSRRTSRLSRLGG
jgi:hypothetical protein